MKTMKMRSGLRPRELLQQIYAAVWRDGICTIMARAMRPAESAAVAPDALEVNFSFSRAIFPAKKSLEMSSDASTPMDAVQVVCLAHVLQGEIQAA